jgi:hypothetical protein
MNANEHRIGFDCKIGMFLRPKALAKQAADEAEIVTERWDVPHEVEVDGKVVRVADDLYDRTSRFQGTRDGRRIAERLLLEDVRTGGPSPAVPLLIGTLAPLLIALELFAAFGFRSGVALVSIVMLADLGLVWAATASGLFALLCAMLLAIAGAGAGWISLGMLSGITPTVLSSAPFMIGAAFLVVLYLAVRPSAHTLRTMLWGIVALAVIAVIAAHAPAWLRPVVLYAPLGILPFAYAWTQQSRWAADCYEQGLLCQGEE